MKLKVTIALIAVLLGGWAGYIGSQQPQVWCNSQWAGISLHKGYYRSWTWAFNDGLVHTHRGWKSIVIDTSHPYGYRFGHYWIPKYHHSVLRLSAGDGLSLSEGTNGTVVITNK